MMTFSAFLRLVERLGWGLLTLLSVLYVVALGQGVEAPLVAIFGDTGPVERVGR